MVPVIYYATGNKFKIDQRIQIVQERSWQIEVVKGVEVGRRASMMKTIEEVVSLKWQIAARGRNKGQILMCDGIDITVGENEPFFRQYYEGKSQEDFVGELFKMMPEKLPEWPKVILKSVVAIGVVGRPLGLFVGLLEGNLFFRPKINWNESLPPIVPYVYVMYWQMMLSEVYGMEIESRRRYVTHDHNTLVQAMDWVEESTLVNSKS